MTPEILIKTIAEGNMTQEVWDDLLPQVKDRVVDRSNLDPSLHEWYYRGVRVQLTWLDGSTSEGYLSRTTGWKPVYILLKKRSSINSGSIIFSGNYAKIEVMPR